MGLGFHFLSQEGPTSLLSSPLTPSSFPCQPLAFNVLLDIPSLIGNGSIFDFCFLQTRVSVSVFPSTGRAEAFAGV